MVNVFDAYCDLLTSQAMQHCASVRTPTNVEPKKLEQAFHICISDGYCKLAFQTCMSNWHSIRQVKFAFQICIPTWHFRLALQTSHFKSAYKCISNLFLCGISSWRFKFALQISMSIWQLTLAFQTGVSTWHLTLALPISIANWHFNFAFFPKTA